MAQNSTSLNRNFNKQLKKYIKNSNKKGTKAIRGVGLQALKMVMIKSPVDKGTFRGNWNVGIGILDRAIDLDRREPQATSEGKSRLGSIKGGEIINISNALPYAMRLEFDAWSSQATNGMVRITLIELTFWLNAQNRRV